MNILDKLPKRLIELMLYSGLQFNISHDSYGTYLDLNTGMKSHAHLFYVDGEYLIRMRYDQQFHVDTLEDVRMVVKACMHGRDFMNAAWSIPIYEGFGEFGDEPLDFLSIE